MNSPQRPIVILLAFLFACNYSYSQKTKPLELDDLLKFKILRSAVISSDGEWVAYHTEPDRGDPEVFVISTDGKKEHHIEVASVPVFTGDGNWVGMTRPVPAIKAEQPGEAGKKSGKKGMVLLNVENGDIMGFDSVRSFSFSNNSEFLFIHLFGENDEEDKKKSKQASPFITVSLSDHMKDTVQFVQSFSVDSSSVYLSYVVCDTIESNNELYIELLNEEFSPRKVFSGDSSTWIDNLCWDKRGSEVAFLSGRKDTAENRLDASLYSWREATDTVDLLLSDDDLEEGWRIYYTNNLEWSENGMLLYLGTKPEGEIISPDTEKKDTLTDLYNIDEILDERGVDVWHWDDPFISPHQKKRWDREKDRTYTGAYSIRNARFIQYATPEMPELRKGLSPTYAVGFSDVPYRKKVTWDGKYRDVYLVNLEAGTGELVEKELKHAVQISPDGKHIVFYKDDHWYHYSSETGEESCMTCDMDNPFYNEDWDYPQARPEYGIAGWVGRSDGIMIYDKFDIWKFSFGGKAPVCLTGGQGRKDSTELRIRNLDPERRWYGVDEKLYISGHNFREKFTAIYRLDPSIELIEEVAGGAYKYKLLKKASDADKYLFTRETHREYPDLRVASDKFRKPVVLSDLGSQTREFRWGNAELVEWNSVDGLPLQGVLIKPDDYDPGRKYPMLVHFYRFFSQRMYDFPRVRAGTNPCYPYYSGRDYLIFLPDIRFDVGTPGYSATKCIVPGVQKLINEGIADPDGVALHGHSWSGYQTAFVITQSDIFSCAVAGAPVSNMTSAYSGIRWGSGLARQFQYEKSQSRIGGSLWEARDMYIENSPVFFANRVETPLLIMFGDDDGAVPWYQGIELYLALRRNEKDCIFLQYRGEPHGLTKLPNKLDYTIKFREYLDHYLKGEEAPAWISEGVPYRGK